MRPTRLLLFGAVAITVALLTDASRASISRSGRVALAMLGVRFAGSSIPELTQEAATLSAELTATSAALNSARSAREAHSALLDASRSRREALEQQLALQRDAVVAAEARFARAEEQLSRFEVQHPDYRAEAIQAGRQAWLKVMDRAILDVRVEEQERARIRQVIGGWVQSDSDMIARENRRMKSVEPKADAEARAATRETMHRLEMAELRNRQQVSDCLEQVGDAKSALHNTEEILSDLEREIAAARSLLPHLQSEIQQLLDQQRLLRPRHASVVASLNQAMSDARIESTMPSVHGIGHKVWQSAPGVTTYAGSSPKPSPRSSGPQRTDFSRRGGLQTQASHNEFFRQQPIYSPQRTASYRAENGDYRWHDNDYDGRKEPTYVRGYRRSDGVYVRGHYRALPGR